MERVEIEQLAFLYLCSSKDKAYVSGEENMSIQDLERFSYILSRLGFTEFGMQLLKEQSDENLKKMDELIEVYEDPNFIADNISGYELEEYENWMEEFCNTAPTKQIRDRLIELFDLDI